MFIAPKRRSGRREIVCTNKRTNTEGRGEVSHENRGGGQNSPHEIRRSPPGDVRHQEQIQPELCCGREKLSRLSVVLTHNQGKAHATQVGAPGPRSRPEESKQVAAISAGRNTGVGQSTHRRARSRGDVRAAQHLLGSACINTENSESYTAHHNLWVAKAGRKTEPGKVVRAALRWAGGSKIGGGT